MEKQDLKRIIGQRFFEKGILVLKDNKPITFIYSSTIKNPNLRHRVNIGKSGQTI